MLLTIFLLVVSSWFKRNPLHRFKGTVSRDFRPSGFFIKTSVLGTVHAVSLTPHATYDTACTVDERFERPWQSLKRNIPPLKNIWIKRGYLWKKIFALEIRTYLGDFEAEFKKALAVNKGPRGYCLMKRTEGRKSRDTVPLRGILKSESVIERVYWTTI
jgi:hypothetical protein